MTKNFRFHHLHSFMVLYFFDRRDNFVYIDT